MNGYVIRFRFPDAPEPMYAVDLGNAYGWGFDHDDAMSFSDRATAERVLENGYGRTKQWGDVIEDTRVTA